MKIDMPVQDGKINQSAIQEKLNMFKFRNITIKFRLTAVIAIMSILLLSIGSMGLFGMDKANDQMLVMYKNSVVPAQQLSGI
ncbi:MAG TPA: Tar ligand binding domain-containing protein, partial [Gallionella sp.]|nr:Tar ligand binding domain-containing protein [Gallionella sp.]